MEPTNQMATTIRESKSSIELQRAKDGTYYWTLKAYFEPGDEEGALATLETVDQTLRAVYLGAPLAAIAA
ncbi:MAG: hypothetical protein EXR58_07515 [Chloroflexi bacterium]|nr:hypothetical protein [Chloroflexota bacterium]